MKIQVRRPNGRFKTLYRVESERTAKDVLGDVYKNLTHNRIPAILSPDGMRITGKAEYIIQD